MAARELTFLLLASISDGLGFGLTGHLFLRHDEGSSRYAR